MRQSTLHLHSTFGVCWYLDNFISSISMQIDGDHVIFYCLFNKSLQCVSLSVLSYFQESFTKCITLTHCTYKHQHLWLLSQLLFIEPESILLWEVFRFLSFFFFNVMTEARNPLWVSKNNIRRVPTLKLLLRIHSGS